MEVIKERLEESTCKEEAKGGTIMKDIKNLDKNKEMKIHANLEGSNIHLDPLEGGDE